MYDDFELRDVANTSTLDHQELLERLQNLTPPIDEEQSLQEAYKLEQEAREELKRDGCPPCYPPNVQLPLNVFPKKYKEIIEYWKSQLGNDYVVLCAQRQDWERFRSWQEKRDRQYSNVSSSGAEHGQLQDLLEFATYHQGIHKKLREDHRCASAAVRHNAGAVEDELPGLRRQRDYTSDLVKKHVRMLDWIEQELAIARKVQSALVSRGGRSRTRRIRKRNHNHRTSSRDRTQEERSRINCSKPGCNTSHSDMVRPTSEHDRAAMKPLRTRSGRVSRRPRRWMPV